jgi:hypothetical protein
MAERMGMGVAKPDDTLAQGLRFVLLNIGKDSFELPSPADES